jgi:hypothetical protein
LSRWLANQGREADDLSSVLLEEFLHARREAGHKTRSKLAYAPLLKHLRQIGVLSEPRFAGPLSATDTLLDGYRRYLVEERGLVQTTVRAYLASANCFLAKRLEASQASLERLLRARSPGPCWPSAAASRGGKRWLTGLRSLLRFLEIEVELNRAAASGWPFRVEGVSLPRYLTADRRSPLLRGCDQAALWAA